MEEQQVEMKQQQGTNNMPVIVGLVLVLAVAGFLVMKNGSKTTSKQEEMTESKKEVVSESSAMEPKNTAREAASGATGMMTDANTTVVTMDAGSFYYKPNLIKVKVGTKVKVVMTSRDMLHDFNIDELNVHGEKTKADATSTVEFTADKIGTFEFYCSVGQHRKMGQVGTLTVE